MLRNTMLIVTLLLAQNLYAETWVRGEPEAVIAGKALYQQYCLACHQADGVGEKTPPPFLRASGYSFAMPLNERSHAWHHSDEQLINTILNGLDGTRMPPWKGVVSASQAALLVAYMKSLWSDKILSCQGSKHMSCMR